MKATNARQILGKNTELGTRVHCRDSETGILGQTIVACCIVHIHVVAYWFHTEDIYRYFACHRSPNTLSRCREAK